MNNKDWPLHVLTLNGKKPLSEEEQKLYDLGVRVYQLAYWRREHRNKPRSHKKALTKMLESGAWQIVARRERK